MITVALAASILLGVPVASADGPENFPSGGPPFVTVSPSDNLVDEQIVAVSGTEFPPSSVVTLTQCATEPPFPSFPENSVCSTLVGGPEIRTDASGNFGPINVPVYEVVVQGDVFGQPRTLYCGPPTSDCDMSAEVDGVVARHQLFFGTDGPGTTTTTAPGGTTTTTAPGGSTTTTVAGGTTTTTAPGGSTTTTVAGGTTTTTAPGGSTTT
ncbi:MAG TPA: neocarzinostatin apoprotein domain-containing protein, partial [Acidimicrobiales bacterium]|nr:neocarzinostatin apoprotein domain-containing protein [Acidimicrobiales bacterium]